MSNAKKTAAKHTSGPWSAHSSRVVEEGTQNFVALVVDGQRSRGAEHGKEGGEVNTLDWFVVGAVWSIPLWLIVLKWYLRRKDRSR